MIGLTNTEILDHEKGRFGNQLFRIGAVVGESMKRNIDYYIPKEWEHSDLFPNLKNKISIDEITRNISSTHREPSFAYHNIPEISGLLEINGFFQSWKYFEGFEDKLINELSFSEENIDKAVSKMSKDTIKLCVHVRWGDVYDRKTGGGHKGFEKWHPTMSLNYYENAINFILIRPTNIKNKQLTNNNAAVEKLAGKIKKQTTIIGMSKNFIKDLKSSNCSCLSVRVRATKINSIIFAMSDD